MMNIWRSQDNYSDHMNRQFETNGLPLRRIDNCAFMIGTTGTCYYRALHAWKGMLLLELARGTLPFVSVLTSQMLSEKSTSAVPVATNPPSLVSRTEVKLLKSVAGRKTCCR